MPQFVIEREIPDAGRLQDAATALVSPVPPGVIDEDPPHQRRRHRDEVRAIAPLHAIEPG